MTAVAIVLDVAFHSGGNTVVSTADLAERTGMARRSLEPLLQALTRERILESTRGPHGGYRMGRPARSLTVAEAVTVGLKSLDDSEPAVSGRLHKTVVGPLWDEFDATLLSAAQGITIEELLRRAARAGLRRAANEPLNFVI